MGSTGGRHVLETSGIGTADLHRTWRDSSLVYVAVSHNNQYQQTSIIPRQRRMQKTISLYFANGTNDFRHAVSRGL